MKLSLFPYKLLYKYPFKIAHTERDGTDALFLKLEHEGLIAWGEAVYPPYYSENVLEAVTFLSSVSLPKELLGLDVLDYIEQLKSDYPIHIFSISGLEMVLNQMKCMHLSTSLNELYGLPDADKATSFTIGISSPDLINKF